MEYTASKDTQLREYRGFSAENRSKVSGPVPNVLDSLPPTKVRPTKAQVPEMTPEQIMAEYERYTSIVIPDLRYALHQQETKYLQRTIEAFDFEDFTFESGICSF